MSGVRQGSRLAHLHALRARLDHEIAAETARHVDATAGRHPEGPARVPAPQARVTALADLTSHEALQRLGVTSAQVREWARGAGHRISSRGRLPVDVVVFYAKAHPDRSTA